MKEVTSAAEIKAMVRDYITAYMDRHSLSGNEMQRISGCYHGSHFKGDLHSDSIRVGTLAKFAKFTPVKFVIKRRWITAPFYTAQNPNLLVNFIRKMAKEFKLEDGVSKSDLLRDIAKGYYEFESGKTSSLEMAIRVLHYWGYGLYMEIPELEAMTKAVPKAASDSDKKILYLNRSRTGNGLVANGFTGW